MENHIKSAFEKRIGKIDHDSFITVVQAFFQDYKENNLWTVPMQYVMINGETELKPYLLELSKGLFALVLITDSSYMNYFKNKNYMEIYAKSIMQLLKDTPGIGGIIINPFLEYHCYLPRTAIFSYMDSAGVKY